MPHIASPAGISFTRNIMEVRPGFFTLSILVAFGKISTEVLKKKSIKGMIAEIINTLKGQLNSWFGSGFDIYNRKRRN